MLGDLEEMVITDVMDDLISPQGKYRESFMLIIMIEVCQEWWVNKKGSWKTLMVPDWKKWSFFMSGITLFCPREIP